MEVLFAEAFHLLGFGDRELWDALEIDPPPGVTPGVNMSFSELAHNAITTACGLNSGR